MTDAEGLIVITNLTQDWQNEWELSARTEQSMNSSGIIALIEAAERMKDTIKESVRAAQAEAAQIVVGQLIEDGLLFFAMHKGAAIVRFEAFDGRLALGVSMDDMLLDFIDNDVAVMETEDQRLKAKLIAECLERHAASIRLALNDFTAE